MNLLKNVLKVSILFPVVIPYCGAWKFMKTGPWSALWPRNCDVIWPCQTSQWFGNSSDGHGSWKERPLRRSAEGIEDTLDWQPVEYFRQAVSRVRKRPPMWSNSPNALKEGSFKMYLNCYNYGVFIKVQIKEGKTSQWLVIFGFS